MVFLILIICHSESEDNNVREGEQERESSVPIIKANLTYPMQMGIGKYVKEKVDCYCTYRNKSEKVSLYIIACMHASI